MTFIKKMIPIFILLLVTTAFAAPDYKACNICQMQSASNPMISCDNACQGIGLSNLIPTPKGAKSASKSAPLATTAGCRACHLCRLQSNNGYSATNCIDQCNTCHLRDPFTGLESHLSGKNHSFNNSPGFDRQFSQEPMPTPAQSSAVVVQPVKGS